MEKTINSAPSSRITVIDALRGFALLGVGCYLRRIWCGRVAVARSGRICCADCGECFVASLLQVWSAGVVLALGDIPQVATFSQVNQITDKQ